MIQVELAKKEMEKPVNLRNVERSLLKRVVDDVMRLNWYFWHPKYQWNQKHITLKHMIQFQCWGFFKNQSKFTSFTDTRVFHTSAMKILYGDVHCQRLAAKINNGFVK